MRREEEMTALRNSILLGHEEATKNLKIVVPFRNVEEWICMCVGTIQKQKHAFFTCVLIDDMSTDNSYEIAEKLIEDDDRFILIKNKDRVGALKNIIDGIESLSPEDEDIIVVIDGDDWLYDKFAFNVVAETYKKEQCLITYSNYISVRDVDEMFNVEGIACGECCKYPDHIINNSSYRQFKWCAGSLRTFKYKLWKEIKIADFLDDEGKYLDVTWDMAFMFPMLEMAGYKQAFIDYPLYVYNVGNPTNDFKIKEDEQAHYEKVIRARPEYALLE